MATLKHVINIYSPKISSKVACSWSCVPEGIHIKHHVTIKQITTPFLKKQLQTHIEDGDDGGVVPADDGGNVLGLGDLRRDQLKDRKIGEWDVEDGRK